MVSTYPDQDQLKEIVKQAVSESLQEQKDLFYDLLAEIIEDLALLKAIKEGETSEPVSREEIFNILDGEA